MLPSYLGISLIVATVALMLSNGARALEFCVFEELTNTSPPLPHPIPTVATIIADAVVTGSKQSTTQKTADRKRVVKGKSVSVRVDLGVPRIITKQNDKTAQKISTLCVYLTCDAYKKT